MGSTRLIGLRFAAIGIGVVLTLPASAAALEFRVLRSPRGGNVLQAEGEIGAGDADRLSSAMAGIGRIEEIWFDSTGGSVNESMRIGELIRSKGFATRIPKGATCASACNFSFLGGVLRAIDPGGRFGVHMFTKSRNADLMEQDAATIRQRGAEGAAEVMKKTEQDSAQLAAREAQYVLSMGARPKLLDPTFANEADSIHWLTPEEQRKYLVVNYAD
jgi:hypothetical protein